MTINKPRFIIFTNVGQRIVVLLFLGKRIIMNITTIVTQMTILLLIMIVGFVGAKKNIFNDEVNVYASNILLRIGIPGLIISSVKNGSPFTGNELFHVLVIFSIFVIFTGVVSKIIVEVLRIKENKALWQFMILFTNAGFMGLPAIQAILGDQAMLYGALFLLPLNCLMYGYGESLFRKGEFSFKKFMNGPMIASVIALILCIFNIKLPYILAQTCTYIGNVTTPLSMMVIGAGLVKMDVKELLDVKVWSFTIFKMILLPLFYMFTLSIFHVDPLIENTLILIMCMPVASNSSVYAFMYGEDATLASKAIFLTSVSCVVTFPIVFILHNL